MTTARLRALFVNENIGGHSALHLYLRQALCEHPVDATFFDVPPAQGWRRVAGAPVPGLAHLDGDLQPLRYQLAQSLSMRRHLAHLGPRHDVIHAYTQNAVLLSTRALRSAPSVISTDTTNSVNAYQLPYRSPGPFTAASLRPAMALERRVFRAATLVVAQSLWTAGLLGGYGVPPERVRVVPFGVPVPSSVSRPTAEFLPRITFVGSSMARKGGWRLLDAFRATLRGRCRLTLVTHDAVSTEPDVEVLNDVQPGDGRLAKILEATDIFALPTSIDKVPYSVLEAMAAGVPVVTTRVAALCEMVADGSTGILVEVDDDRGLVQALLALVEDREHRRRMGDAARQRVLDHFDARRTTAALLEVLAEAKRLHRAAAAPVD